MLNPYPCGGVRDDFRTDVLTALNAAVGKAVAHDSPMYR